MAERERFRFIQKVFSTKRMERYFALYPDDEARAIRHYECNLMLAESLYVSLSVLEVTLRNALCRELETMTGRERQRRNVSAPLNTFRRFRNRIFHNESICWNLSTIRGCLRRDSQTDGVGVNTSPHYYLLQFLRTV